MKILFTTPELKHPPVGGPYLRVENSIKALNKISELHIISRVGKKSMGGDVAESFYKSYCKNFLYTPNINHFINKRSLKYKLKKLFCGKDKDSIPKQNDSDFIINYAVENNIEIIWFGYGNISYDLMKEVRSKAPNLKLVCDTDSIWSRFVLRGLPYARNEQEKEKIQADGKKKEIEEKDWVEFCDVTTAVSKIDADYYKSLTEKKDTIKVFSNVIDLDNYKIKPPKPKNFKTPNIYFAGYFGPNSPTDVAARWVINDILPIIKKTIPDIHFYILGRASDTTLADIKNPNVTITGQLDSVLPYLCNADISLVPLKFESGTRFKILEAAACGIPIVSTKLGAEGIPINNGENIIIADEAEDFANAIIKLLQNKELAKKIAKNCKEFIDANYSVDKQAKEAKEIIKYLK